MRTFNLKQHPWYLKLLLIANIAALLFIWVHSMIPIPVSAEESNFIKEIVTPALEVVVGAGNVTDHLVRKMAHVIEFAGFAFLNCLYLQLLWIFHKKLSHHVFCRKFWKISLISTAICLFVACCDETIQIFSNRGAGIGDVCLDFVSSCISIILTTILVLICSKIHKDKFDAVKHR